MNYHMTSCLNFGRNDAPADAFQCIRPQRDVWHKAVSCRGSIALVQGRGNTVKIRVHLWLICFQISCGLGGSNGIFLLLGCR
jgi:hypothetical protein